MRVEDTGTSKTLTLARTQPHNLSLGVVQSESAGLQPSLDVQETRSETYNGCLSVPGRSADVDLRIIGILVQVEAMTSDNEGQLS